MELGSLLLFGMLIGMQHALEADHLAAVAAMSARRSTRRQLVLRGASWGVGHTLSLFAICSAALLLGFAVSARFEAALDLGVGVMVALLGAHVLFTLHRQRIHFHAHEHSGSRHVHAHSHLAEPAAHRQSSHEHPHPRGYLKAMAVGLVHGAAGSGALLVLVVAAAKSTLAAVSYVVAFGVGSIAGMAALSLVASFPLKALERAAGWLSQAVMAAVGAFAVLIGGHLVVESVATLGFGI
jgi:hypothetical protein